MQRLEPLKFYIPQPQKAATSVLLDDFEDMVTLQTNIKEQYLNKVGIWIQL